jgi:hypothetical protein
MNPVKCRQKAIKKNMNKLGVMVHTCNPSTWEVKSREMQVQGQSVQHSKTLSQKKEYKFKNTAQQLLP